MAEAYDDRSGQFAGGIVEKEPETGLPALLHSVTATSFEWDIESDKFVRHFSKEPAFPANRDLPESLNQVRTVVYPIDLIGFDAAFDSLLANGSDYHNLFRVIRLDRTIVWLEEWGQLERDGHGTRQKLRGFSINVTDRMRSFCELEELNRFFGSRLTCVQP